MGGMRPKNNQAAESGFQNNQYPMVHFRNRTTIQQSEVVINSTLKSMEFTKTNRNHCFSVILVTTSDLNSREQPTKTIQNTKICLKLSQALGKNPFPGWNQLSNSLKSRSRDDRYIEYLKIHGFHQNPQKSLIFIDFGDFGVDQRSRQYGTTYQNHTEREDVFQIFSNAWEMFISRVEPTVQQSEVATSL